MKKPSKKRLLLRKEKLLRKHNRWKNIKKGHNITRENTKKRHYYNKRLIANSNNSYKNRYVNDSKLTLEIDEFFSLLEHPDNVLGMVQHISKSIKKRVIKEVRFDLTRIKKIDIGALGIILSKFHELSHKKINCWGNLPQNTECSDFIYDSGFLNYMQDLHGNKFKIKENNKNLLIKRGFDRTSNSKVAFEIRNAVEHLTGVNETFRPVFSMVQEMCANSIEHANETNKNWLFAILYLEDKVAFTMTDIGKGILGTLKKKGYQKVTDVRRREFEILERAFDKRYISQTYDQNRNKGLPKIKKISDENFVENLIVITNNVFLHFNNKKDSKLLNKGFHGTFYYWELTQTCIEKWKNRELN